MLTPAVLALITLFHRAPAPPPQAGCPTAPAQTYATTPRACPALDVAGRIDASGVSLDPAFDVAVPVASLLRPVASPAMLAGYDAEGREVFAVPVPSTGLFHADVPLAPAMLRGLARLRLVAPSGTSEQVAHTRSEPAAEAVVADDAHAVFTWNANAYPAIRIATEPGTQPIAYAGGTATLEETTLETRARRLYVQFSDGVRSVEKSVPVFGR